jgi:hypothetical protein
LIEWLVVVRLLAKSRLLLAAKLGLSIVHMSNLFWHKYELYGTYLDSESQHNQEETDSVPHSDSNLPCDAANVVETPVESVCQDKVTIAKQIKKSKYRY